MERLAAILWSLWAVFVCRVLGQVLVMLDVAPWLPPVEAWQSGLLPYPLLLASQVLVLCLYGTVCWQFTRGWGLFVAPRPRLGVWLIGGGSVYAGLMGIRFLMWLHHDPGEQWMGGPLPIVFHWVLASFLLTVGWYHVGALHERR